MRNSSLHLLYVILVILLLIPLGSNVFAQQNKELDELISSEQYSELLEQAELILKNDPKNLEGLYYKARAHLGLENYKESVVVFDEVFQNSEIFTNKLIYNYGRALYGVEDFDLAYKYFNSIHSSDGLYSDSLNFKGLSLIKLGNNTQAVGVFDELLKMEENSLRAYSNKASALTKLGNFTDALSSIDQALNIDDSYVLGIITKGDVFFHQGKYGEAIEYYDNALKIDSNNLIALNQKGLALYHLERYEESLKIFDKMLMIDENSTEALINKAVIFIDLANYDDAIPLLEQVLAKDPFDVDALNNLGGIYFKLEKYNIAIEFLDKSLQVETDVGTLNNKILALGALENHEEALRVAEQALLIEPTNEQAEKNRQIASEKIALEKTEALRLWIVVIITSAIASLFFSAAMLIKRYTQKPITPKTSFGTFVLNLVIIIALIMILSYLYVDLIPGVDITTEDGELSNFPVLVISSGITVSVALIVFLYSHINQKNTAYALEKITAGQQNIVSVLSRIESNLKSKGGTKNSSNISPHGTMPKGWDSKK